MANQLEMAEQHSIITLWKRGWSRRRIARTLGIHRETVSRYVRLAAAEATVGAAGPPGVSRPLDPDGRDAAKPATDNHLKTGHFDCRVVGSAEPVRPLSEGR